MPEPGATEPAEASQPNFSRLRSAVGDLVDLPPFHVKIGNYELKREIAVGGMGTVFEAIQQQPRRSVAVKLMRGGLSSASALRRFEFESQLLARLRHPGIAQVFEAGTHRHGELEVPYYVMEYIPGARPITSYADTQKLTIRQRLELFASICDALHYAHQCGIIHRDIKPGNVLVDGEGRAKIIDFGVARAADGDMTAPTLHTEADRVVGTLQYMSPEQCQTDPADLDARTDVYALGVVLYELLCARLPYDVSRGNLSDASRIIREQPPVAPRHIRPDLSQDLEVILLKALHKDRDRRYSSAAELAGDVRHVLAGEPIEARRDSASYVLRKRAGAIVAAHRISTWIVATVLACLLANGITALLHLWTGSRLFYRTITGYVSPANAMGPMSMVRMIAIRQRTETEFEELARSLGIEGVRSDDWQTLRLLHRALFEKLAQSGARVLAIDIGFEKPKPDADPSTAPAEPIRLRFEQDLLEGIAALRKAKCEVVLAAGGDWTIGPDDLPESLTPGMAAATYFGFATAVVERDAPWSLDLILKRKDAATQPSLALAACAAYWRPGQFHWVDFDADRKINAIYAKLNYVREGVLRPRRWQAPAEDQFDRIPVSYQVIEQDDPHANRRKDDAIGHFILHVPPDAVVQAATIDYARVLDPATTADQLRQWFASKVVVLGDDRLNADGPHFLPDGRSYSGFVAQAVGIDSILRTSPILEAPRVVIFGMSIFSQTIFGFLGTLGGSIVGLAGLEAWRRRAALNLGWIILLLGASLLLYRQRGLLFDPTVAILGAVLAGELVNLLCPGRGERLG